MTFQMMIFDPDLSTVAELKSAFSDLASVSIRQVERMLYLQPPIGLDVLYLPLTVAERWGSRPLIRESQILATSPADQQTGLPPFIVTGTCLADDDPRGPIPETTLLLASAFRAIRGFNNESDFKLKRIGFWGYNLL